MCTPTDGELSQIVNGPGPLEDMPRLARLWLRPVEPLLPVLRETRDKPLGQLTVPELLTWAACLGYMVASMALAETLALNLVRVAVRGR